MGRVTAIFDTQGQAERAVSELRGLGMTDTQLSFVSRNGDSTRADDVAGGAGKGALAGAGVGALFGLAAILIPGIGPFMAAGAFAHLLGITAGGVATGALVGGTAGAVAGALARAGYSPDEAEYYGSAVEHGGVLVAVDTTGPSSDASVRSILSQHGGRTYGI